MSVTTLPPPRPVDDPADGHGEATESDRWRPARAGLIALWRFWDETFSFHNGRLLLRGPNGSGKSMALELLLPFLLDANASPHRLTSAAKFARRAVREDHDRRRHHQPRRVRMDRVPTRSRRLHRRRAAPGLGQHPQSRFGLLHHHPHGRRRSAPTRRPARAALASSARRRHRHDGPSPQLRRRSPHGRRRHAVRRLRSRPLRLGHQRPPRVAQGEAVAESRRTQVVGDPERSAAPTRRA